MYSMTGYGKGVAQRDGRELTVELKSVNHRFLDIGLRLPRQLGCIEDTLRITISQGLSRGHVDVFINYRNTRSDAKTVVVDKSLLSAYVLAAREANTDLGLKDDLTLSNVLRLPDVAEIIASEDDSLELNALCREAAQMAVAELKKMRHAEGERLKNDLSNHLCCMEELAHKIAQRAPFIAEDYRKRLNERIEALLLEAQIDRARLATEVALFADRAAIDEEITRLNSHHRQFHLLLDDSEPVGRRLDFIIQEMNRECNTIGSKANDAELTGLVLACKSQIEKLREQIQNIE